jgi:hypothetical protein
VKRLLAVIAGLAIALIGTVAVAAWLSSGDGNGTATATTVNQANAPTATRGSGSVGLTWTASALANNAPVGGYRVVRHVGSSTSDVCTVTLPAALTCTDNGPIATAVSYGVIATIGTHWQGPESSLTAFTYDNVAPVTTANVSPAPNAATWNNTAVTVALQASDSGSPNSGVDHLSYTIDGGSAVVVNAATTSFTVSGAGTHTVGYNAVDGAGNPESSHTLTIKIDPSAPTTTVTPTVAPNGSGWNNADVTLNFSAVDTDASGVKSVTVDGATTNGSTASKLVSTEGTTTVSYFATDVADNVEGTKTTTVKIDKTKPTASIDPAGGTSWTNDNTVAITASDPLSGVASTQYSIDGGALQPYTLPVTLADGTCSFRYVVADNAGNVTDLTATIKVDSVKPSSTIANTTSTTWTISASDAVPSSGLSIEYWVDSGSHTTVSGTSAVVTVADGSHTIHWFAKDAAGNQQDQQNLSVTVASADNVAPQISNVEPGTVSGSWSAIDCSVAAGKPCATVTDNVGVTSVTMTLVKLGGRCWDGNGGTTNFGTTCPEVPMSLSNGVWVPTNVLVWVSNNGAASFNNSQYTLTITAKDAAGNTATVTRTFTASSA